MQWQQLKGGQCLDTENKCMLFYTHGCPKGPVERPYSSLDRTAEVRMSHLVVNQLPIPVLSKRKQGPSPPPRRASPSRCSPSSSSPTSPLSSTSPSSSAGEDWIALCPRLCMFVRKDSNRVVTGVFSPTFVRINGHPGRYSRIAGKWRLEEVRRH